MSFIIVTVSIRRTGCSALNTESTAFQNRWTWKNWSLSNSREPQPDGLTYLRQFWHHAPKQAFLRTLAAWPKSGELQVEHLSRPKVLRSTSRWSFFPSQVHAKGLGLVNQPLVLTVNFLWTCCYSVGRTGSRKVHNSSFALQVYDEGVYMTIAEFAHAIASAVAPHFDGRKCLLRWDSN